MVKCTVTLLWLPAVSAAMMTSECDPSAVTGVPLTNGAPSSVAATDARFASPAEKIGTMGGAFDDSPSVTPLRVMVGGVVS